MSKAVILFLGAAFAVLGFVISLVLRGRVRKRIESGMLLLTNDLGGRLGYGAGRFVVESGGCQMELQVSESAFSRPPQSFKKMTLFFRQRFTLEGFPESWSVTFLEDSYRTINNTRIAKINAAALGHELRASDRLILSIEGHQLEMSLREFIQAFLQSGHINLLMSPETRLIPSKLQWNGKHLEYTWWTHEDLGFNDEEARRSFGEVWRATSKAREDWLVLEEGALGLYMRQVRVNQPMAVFAMMVSLEQVTEGLPALILKALEDEHVELCLAVAPFELLREHLGDALGDRVQVARWLERCHELEIALRRRGMGVELLRGNMSALGALYANFDEGAERDLRAWSTELPYTFALAIAGLEPEERFRALVGQVPAIFSSLSTVARAPIVTMAAEYETRDTSPLLRALDARVIDEDVADALASVAPNLLVHHPERLVEPEIAQVLASAMEVASPARARVIRDVLIEGASPTLVGVLHGLLDASASMARSRRLVFEQVIASLTKRGRGASGGGLSLVSGEAGGLTMASGEGGALTQVDAPDES